jgi:hypothetical protein
LGKYLVWIDFRYKRHIDVNSNILKSD